MGFHLSTLVNSKKKKETFVKFITANLVSLNYPVILRILGFSKAPHVVWENTNHHPWRPSLAPQGFTG